METVASITGRGLFIPPQPLGQTMPHLVGSSCWWISHDLKLRNEIISTQRRKLVRFLCSAMRSTRVAWLVVVIREY